MVCISCYKYIFVFQTQHVKLHAIQAAINNLFHCSWESTRLICNVLMSFFFRSIKNIMPRTFDDHDESMDESMEDRRIEDRENREDSQVWTKGQYK